MNKLFFPLLFLGSLFFTGAASGGIPVITIIPDRGRPELEQLKAFRDEIGKSEAERNDFEDNKTKPIMGEFPSESKAREIGRDGRFVAYDNGIVMDNRTGLEWIAGPDRDTTWDEARSWVQSLSVKGGGWRMPTREELRTLYKKGSGTRNMTPLLKTTGWWLWSGVKWGIASARVFSFHHGFEHSHPLSDSRDGRAFAVRSRR